MLTQTKTHAPKRIKMSYEQYLELAPDSQKVEWVDGEAIVYMPPQTIHQKVALFLSRLIADFSDFFKLGTVLPAPYEVKLWPGGPSRQPDLLFISSQNLPHLTAERYLGGPDLVVEILSPGSVTEDRVRKFSEYEKAGVREYWIIDPRPHQQQADFFLLGEDQQFHSAPLDEGGIFRSGVLPGFWLELAWLWQEPLPNPQLCLSEIMLTIEDLPEEARRAYQATRVLHKS